jgi:NADPH:quinone reductase
MPAALNDPTGMRYNALEAAESRTREPPMRPRGATMHESDADRAAIDRTIAWRLAPSLLLWLVIARIGTATISEKAGIAGANGVVLNREGGFAARARALNGGEGVRAVHDAVGREAVAEALESLASCGTLVDDGQASGTGEPVAPATLGLRSNALAWPWVFHDLRDRAALEALAAEVCADLAAGVLRPETGLRLPLAEAGRAYAALEARATTGAVVLIP